MTRMQERARQAYQVGLQSWAWGELDKVDVETRDEAQANPDDLISTRTAATEMAQSLNEIEQKCLEYGNEAQKIAARLRLAERPSENEDRVQRALMVISKLVAVKEVAAAFEHATNIDTFNKELLGKCENLSRQLEGVRTEIKSLGDEIANKENPLTGPTQVVPNVLDRFLTLASGAQPDDGENAQAEMSKIMANISQPTYYEHLRRDGLAEWLSLDPEGSIYKRGDL